MLLYNQMRLVSIANDEVSEFTFGPFNKADIFRRALITLVSTDTSEAVNSTFKMDVRVKNNPNEAFANARSLIQGADSVPGSAELLVPASVGVFVMPVNWIPDEEPMWLTIMLNPSTSGMTGGLEGSIFIEAGPQRFFV